MFGRAIAIILVSTVTLSPGAAMWACGPSAGRTPPSDRYGQAGAEAALAGAQEPRAPYPPAARRPAAAERLAVKAAAASAELGRVMPAARRAAADAEPPARKRAFMRFLPLSDRPVEASLPTSFRGIFGADAHAARAAAAPAGENGDLRPSASSAVVFEAASQVAGDTGSAENGRVTGVEPSGGLVRTGERPAEASMPGRTAIFRAARGLPGAAAATCTVTSRADSGAGSLRECLSQTAANGTIVFDPAIFPPASPMTIALASALPRITVAHLTVDGSSAGVVLDGSQVSTGAGLVIDGAEGAAIRGLQILNFRFGIALINGARSAVVGGDRAIGTAPLGQGNVISGSRYSGVILQGSGVANNRVTGNNIGTDVTGTKAAPNGEHGVALVSGANGNIVGGESAGLRNVISGNARAGVVVKDAGSRGNRVLGNNIGADAAGAHPLANNVDGVEILGGAADNIVGGETAGARNLISGNGDSGVWIEGSGTTGNRVLGNFIGADITGARAISNTIDGVVLAFGAKDNLVGGDTPGAGNLVSGNGRIGVNVNADCAGNRILGNTIGADASGTAALGNADIGVLIGFGAHDNLVGGDTAAARNLISGNGLHGVLIKDVGTAGNVVRGNFIGTDASGSVSLGNGQVGILVAFGARDNTIGGAAVGAGNLISGNGISGVWMRDAGTMGNVVSGNLIGVDRTGARGLGNGNDGITIVNGAGGNVIGGDAAGAGNLISGNGDRGITIEGRGSDANRVLGNTIGADVTGMKALGNRGDGIVIKAGASNNVVGGDTPGARNLISGHDDGDDQTDQAGIWIEDADTAGNRVAGNTIGVDAAGRGALGNGGAGIGLALGAHDTVIGGEAPGAGNVIGGNRGHGVMLQQAGTDRNRIVGNIIGLDATGTYSLTNGYTGVFIGFAASNNAVGGETPGARNLINGGVWLQSPGTTGNRVLGNTIGTDASGTAAAGNHGDGVILLNGPSGNVVGGETPAAGNLISGNARHGVVLEGAGTTANAVKGNIIGADVTGARALGNAAVGVLIQHGASGNLIGGSAPGAGNLLSGNGWCGVQLQDPGTSGNRVQGNTIGTDATGTRAIPNVSDGVVIGDGASDNLVGGEAPGEGNLISGNGRIGVNLTRSADYAGDGVTGNRVLGNIIGPDVTGTRAVGNGQFGVHIGFGAYDNVVGGDKPGMRNIIGGNGSAGVLIKNLGTAGNRVLGNIIGADVTGTHAIPNALDGVAICCAAAGNMVGGEAPGAGNLISANGGAGVWVGDAGTTRNRIVGNTIGADRIGAASGRLETAATVAKPACAGSFQSAEADFATVAVTLSRQAEYSNRPSGAGPLGNLQGGVEFAHGSQGNILGPGNAILFNDLAGVIISGETTLHNTITRNSIHHNGGPPIGFTAAPKPIGPAVLDRYSAGSRTLTGSACAGCRVEVFANPDAQPAGTVYLATATADASGAFVLALSSPPSLPFLHATVTDPPGTTSEFSTGLNTGRARCYLPIVLR